MRAMSRPIFAVRSLFLLGIPVQALMSSPRQQAPCPANLLSGSAVEWLALDNHREMGLELLSVALTADASPSEKLDGLIQELNQFLCEKSFARTEGHSANTAVELQWAEYNRLAQGDHLKTVCETGFNAGHSALRFLALSDANFYSFDIGNHDYAKPAAEFLQKKFPGRLVVTWGNSLETLPAFREEHPEVRCDIAIVDGGHSREVAESDLLNFMPMTSPNSTVALDDTPCNAQWCQGPGEAWQKLKAQGIVIETKQVPMGENRGFTLGKYVHK